MNKTAATNKKATPCVCSSLSRLNAEDVMSSPVFTIPLNGTMRELSSLFLEKNISAAAVLDDKGAPVGVITKTDLARLERDHVDVKTMGKPSRLRDSGEPATGRGLREIPEDDTVESWMTPFVFDTHPRTPLVEALQKMVKYGLHHIFVTEPGAHKVIGALSAFDVLSLMARAFKAEGR